MHKEDNAITHVFKLVCGFGLVSISKFRRARRVFDGIESEGCKKKGPEVEFFFGRLDLQNNRTGSFNSPSVVSSGSSIHQNTSDKCGCTLRNRSIQLLCLKQWTFSSLYVNPKLVHYTIPFFSINTFMNEFHKTGDAGGNLS